MDIKYCLSLILIAISFTNISCVLNPKVVCYYENWIYYHAGQAQMTTDHINSSLCTDIVYGYMGTDANGNIFTKDDWLVYQKDGVGDLHNFALKKGKANALVSVGGESGSVYLKSVFDSVSGRTTFVNSAYAFLLKWNLDGLTIDWSKSVWLVEEFENFTKLLQELRAKFGNQYKIGISIAALATNFDIRKVDSSVDFISVNTFDLHGPGWESQVDYEAPLGWQNEVLRTWYSKGATMNKLLLTIPLYGHTWNLADPTKNTPGSPSVGNGGAPWPLSNITGKINYVELCNDVKSYPTSWSFHRNDTEAEVYAVKDRLWISYEDPTSCEIKARNITSQGYGGITVQALSNDDYRGTCGQTYPLLKGINNGLNINAVIPATPGPIITTIAPITTVDPNVLCHKKGTVRDPKDCNVYHKCTEMFPGVYDDAVHYCPTNQAYDETKDLCVDKSLVPGCH